MKLSIVIVSWNVKDLLKKCLSSVFDNQGDIELEVFVVDNNSADDSVKMVQEEFPQVKLIANSKNLGFATANNQAIKQARGEYVLVLNPDTEILPDTLEKSLQFMAGNPDCGAMGCQILSGDKTIQPSVRRFPKFWPIFLMMIKAPKIFKNLKAINKYLATDFDYSATQEVDQIMGAYMLIPQKAFTEIGMFDEKFFIWFEEVDLCRRIKQAGKKVFYYPEPKIIHYGGSSFAQQSRVTKQMRFFKSAWHYFMKNGF